MSRFLEPYYYEDEDYDLPNPEAEQLEQRIDDAIDWFKEACDILYGKKDFDIGHLDTCLSEVSLYLGCKIPINDLQVVSNNFLTQKTV